MPNTILKRWNGTAFEELYPKTTISQIVASGSPTSNTALFGDSTWKTTPTGSGTTNQITYWSGGGTLAALSTGTYPSLTELSYVKGVTSAIQTQLDRVVVKNKATNQAATTSTPILYESISLVANAYYQINMIGTWSRSTSGPTCSPSITINVDDTTGTPTFNGVFEWLNVQGSTAYSTKNQVGNITTSTTAHGFIPTAGTTNNDTYFGIKGIFYSGTTAKLLRVYIALSIASGATANLQRIAITATRVA